MQVVGVLLLVRVVGEVGREIQLIRADFVEVQPLPREVLESFFGLGVLEHSKDFFFENRRGKKRVVRRAFKKLGIRHAGPEKVGESAGQLPGAQSSLACGVLGVSQLDQVEKLRTLQQYWTPVEARHGPICTPPSSWKLAPLSGREGRRPRGATRKPSQHAGLEGSRWAHSPAILGLFGEHGHLQGGAVVHLHRRAEALLTKCCCRTRPRSSVKVDFDLSSEGKILQGVLVLLGGSRWRGADPCPCPRDSPKASSTELASSGRCM